jgi:hypothetical protein
MDTDRTERLKSGAELRSDVDSPSAPRFSPYRRRVETKYSKTRTTTKDEDD